jgi:hypothetical protein
VRSTPALVLILLSAAAAPARAADLCPVATVNVVETAPPGKPHKLQLAALELALLDAKGAQVAATKTTPKHWMGPAPAQDSFVEHRWPLPCLKPDGYALEARFKLKGDKALRTERLLLPLGKGETDLRVYLSFTARAARDGKPALALFTAARLLPALGTRLRSQWTPHPRGEARYALENRTAEPLYGVGVRGHFLGTVERQDPRTGTWQEFPRGSVVPPAEPGQPVPPHGAGTAREHDVGPQPAPYTPGRYRFTVEYQHVPVGGAPRDAAGGTAKRVYDRYRAAVEFEIR